VHSIMVLLSGPASPVLYVQATFSFFTLSRSICFSVEYRIEPLSLPTFGQSVCAATVDVRKNDRVEETVKAAFTAEAERAQRKRRENGLSLRCLCVLCASAVNTPSLEDQVSEV